jgi:hypothetical protein
MGRPLKATHDKTVRMTIILPKGLRDRLETEARGLGTSLSALVSAKCELSGGNEDELIIRGKLTSFTDTKASLAFLQKMTELVEITGISGNWNLSGGNQAARIILSSTEKVSETPSAPAA